VQERLKVTVVVLVNGGYQSIHALQRSTVATSFGNEFRARVNGDRAPAGPVVEVDYAANARSMGAAAWTVRTVDELTAALDEASSEAGPAVIACHVEPRRGLVGSGAWWDLGVPEVAEDPDVAARAAAHAGRRSGQRFLG
jgi:3D-(3,5/4)-trihydroxycyclohexane-1,2-dione acylhydrolase (decyclizing)